VECATHLLTNEACRLNPSSPEADAIDLQEKELSSYSLLQVYKWFEVRYGSTITTLGSDRRLTGARCGAAATDIVLRRSEPLVHALRHSSDNSSDVDQRTPKRYAPSSQQLSEPLTPTIYPQTLYEDM